MFCSLILHLHRKPLRNLALDRRRGEGLMSVVFQTPLGQATDEGLSTHIIRVQNHRSSLFKMPDEQGVYQNKQEGCSQGSSKNNKGNERTQAEYSKCHRGNNDRQSQEDETKEKPV